MIDFFWKEYRSKYEFRKVIILVLTVCLYSLPERGEKEMHLIMLDHPLQLVVFSLLSYL